MKISTIFQGVPFLTCLALAGCINNDYDLSDIDTTTEIKVKDLILPVNLDPITLGDIFDIKEGDKIQIIEVDGKPAYGIRESGSFSSLPIEIPMFTAPAPDIQPSSISFDASGIAGPVSSPVALDLIDPVGRKVTYKAENIDNAIKNLTELYSNNLTYTISFSLNNLPGFSPELTDLDLTMPVNLLNPQFNCEASYDASTGKTSIPSLKFTNGEAVLTVFADGIAIPDGSGFDPAAHSLTLVENIVVEDASLKLTPLSSSASLSSSVNINADYSVSPIDVRAVSGDVMYIIDGVDISPIDLGTLPDFLADEETELILFNPQIYLSLTNPVADDNLGYQTGLTLTAIRDNYPSQSFHLDNGFFRVGTIPTVGDRYNFCLSHVMPQSIPEQFKDASHVPFFDLGRILSGPGLPKRINIQLDQPQIYQQSVKKFMLGKTIDGVKGDWEFFAPLSLTSIIGEPGGSSKIVYSKTVDGWNDDDIDAITINTLEISLNVDNNTPLDAKISGYPIDVNGNQIGNVKIEGATVPPNAKGEPVKIHITGEVKHLDGIKFTATIRPYSEDPLSPDQNLVLSNVKAKVTGNYTKEL